MELTRKQIEEGSAYAKYNLGRMYWDTGVAKDRTEAVKWFRLAAEENVLKAQIDLATAYLRGEGVAKDSVEALNWYRKAAEQGDMYAQKDIGLLYQRGEGVAQDFVEAAKWFRRSADQGYDWAQCFLGNAYLRGEGVAKNAAEALAWYRKAAAQGHALSQSWLGWMYYNGEGVQRDFGQAAQWYRKAAEGGDLTAQQMLGVMYANGLGVPKSDTEAAKWYGKPIEQLQEATANGDPEALNNVAWFLATVDSAAIRNGRKAVEAAEKAVAATGRTNGRHLDTLAAAYAETGDFEKAVKTQKEAQPLMRGQDQEGGAERLKLYEAKTPYRQRE